MPDERDDPVFQLIFSLLRSAHCVSSPLPAAEVLYNEGWLLRVVIGFEASGIRCLPIEFEKDAQWLSQPFLYSAFGARCRGDDLAEGHTRADAVVGHVAIDEHTKRGLILTPKAKQFVVLEAKVYSELRPGTTNAPGYDQAVRNVACMAEALRRCDHSLDEFTSLGFFVVAPQETAATHEPLLDRQQMQRKVAKRISGYDVSARDELETWNREWFDPLLQRIRIEIVTWEDIIRRVEEQSPEVGSALRLFYERCEQFNRPRQNEIRREGVNMPVFGQTYLHQGKLVVVVRVGPRSSRVVEYEHPGPYFRRSYTVPNETLETIEERPSGLPVPAGPVPDQEYVWDPPDGEDPQPPGRPNVPDDSPKRARMLTPGWHTSAVVEIDDGGTDVGERFWVFTHHLRLR
ncbi:MAG: hypothetical protein HQ581_14260 [Planctomycetes bacterium]|nr:hypothetical protein [Planctomycetota bacterium]